MLKKFFVGWILLPVILLGGCGSPAGQNGNTLQQGQPASEAAKQEPHKTRAELEAFLNREPNSVMAYAGPFYFGSHDGFAPESQKYSEQRRQKVEEILAVIDGGIVTLGNLDKKLKEEKEIFSWYVKEIQKIDKSIQKYTDGLLNATNQGLLSSALSNLMVLKKQGDAMDLSAAWGFLQFQKYGDFVALTNLYGVETASLMSRITALYYLLESDKNTAYQDLNKQLIAKMDPVSDASSDLLDELYRATAIAGYGEKLLFTADYYFTKDTVKNLDVQIAAARKSFAEYKGSNQNLSAKMLALLKKKLDDLEIYRNRIMAYLHMIPADELVAKEKLAFKTGAGNGGGRAVLDYLIPVANAQMDIPGWFQQKVSDTIKTVKSVKNLGFAAVRVTGQAIKDTYDKSGAHEVVKDGAQIVNAGIEGVNSTVKIAIAGAQGVYYGDMSWADFKKRIEAEKAELHDKFVKGTLGKEQFDEMIRQVDAIQERTGKFVNSMGELSGDVTSIVTGQPKLGKFVKEVTVAVGNEAKGVVDTVTGFSKSIAIVMHPETSKEDTRKALLDIYTSLKGIKDDEGKLIEIEIPDLADLTKEKAMEQLTKDISKAAGMDDEEEKEFLDQLKDTFEKQLTDKETPDDTKKADEKKDPAAADKTDGKVPDAETTPDGDKDPTAPVTPDATAPDAATPGAPDSTSPDGTTPDGADKTGAPEGTDKMGAPDGTAPDGSDTKSTPKNPLDEIFTNPNLTDEEIQNIILGEITKDLPPLPEKTKTDVTKDTASLDTDNDGFLDAVDNCESVANPDQADTDKDSIGNMCDPDCSGDGDADGTCNEIDNCPLDANADQKDSDNDGKGDICDFDAPPISEIVGTWPGSITVTDVMITDEFRASAKKEGCDISEMEKSKGQTKPMSLVLEANGENAGFLILKGEDMADKKIPFTYVDGVMKASISDQGIKLDINQTFSGKTSTGEMNMDFMNGQAKISSTTSFTK
jgi:hypothetical protein